MNILAAFIFFTRLPFWKIKTVPPESFRNVVGYWPIVGWLTGGSTALILWLSAMILPSTVAILLAIAWRVLLTGALHEDGLADFFDGFGGGQTRERILAIMKDSHIGTYGVLGLILYFLLLASLLISIPIQQVIWIVFAGDVWSKFVAAQLPNFLPYARKEEESKIKTIYNRMKPFVFIRCLIFGVLPVVLLPLKLWFACLLPVIVFFILCYLMKKRLQGYTGDCCGATFLLCELSFYLAIVIILQNLI